jgi:hypothetical protein
MKRQTATLSQMDLMIMIITYLNHHDHLRSLSQISPNLSIKHKEFLKSVHFPRIIFSFPSGTGFLLLATRSSHVTKLYFMRPFAAYLPSRFSGGIFILFLLVPNLILFSSCHSTNKIATEEGTPLRLLNAEYEEWTAGVKDGGRGTEYYFQLNVATSDQVQFDSAWIGGKVFASFVARPSGPVNNQPVSFKKGDNITLRVSDLRLPAAPAASNAVPPVNYKGAALLRYRINGKINYLNVPDLTKKTTPNRG